jgi:hypothetical protein
MGTAGDGGGLYFFVLGAAKGFVQREKSISLPPRSVQEPTFTLRGAPRPFHRLKKAVGMDGKRKQTARAATRSRSRKRRVRDERCTILRFLESRSPEMFVG